MGALAFHVIAASVTGVQLPENFPEVKGAYEMSRRRENLSLDAPGARGWHPALNALISKGFECSARARASTKPVVSDDGFSGMLRAREGQNFGPRWP